MTTAVILGHNLWEEYTLPLINSIQEHEPECKIVVVDNGSEPPYPMGVRADNSSVANGLNAGLMASKDDWYLMLGNDAICTGPFLHLFDGFCPHVIYGAELREWEVFHYLIGWCMAISAEALDDVGYFDEDFAPMFYEEVDWLFRAEQAGYRQQQIGFPFTHFKHKSHQFVNDVEGVREKNKALFMRKAGLDG